MFLTDGNCSESDEKRTDDVIRQMAEENIFVQFIGIGRNSFTYIHHLDDFKDVEDLKEKYILSIYLIG